MDICGKELTSWLSAFAVLLYAVLIVCMRSFPIWFMGKDLEFDCICS